MKALVAVAAVLVLAGALSGCLGSGQKQPDALTPNPPENPAPLPAPTPAPAPTVPSARPPELNQTATAPPAPAVPDPGPQVVIAHIDTGINPYHKAFRDDSALAQVHPCLWLAGYPCNATALRLTFNATSYADAVAQDQAVWDKVEAGKLYWIPGTRIVGAISFHPGGTLCNEPLLDTSGVPVPIPANPVAAPAVQCVDHKILDDFGHGTMTASRMAAKEHSLCPTCRIVSIEGLGGDSVQWAAQQGWIDVQTNSWGSLVPAPVPSVPAPDPVGPTPGGADIRAAFAFAASKMLVFVASGNGLAFHGGVGEPTYYQATEASGVITVGAHDNGRVTLYQGQPPMVVADGYGGWRANHTSLDEFIPSPESCCTSAASPYAAGGAAAILLQARVLEGQRGTGFPDGTAAAGGFKATAGPLSDGKFTLQELHDLVLHSAQARPTEGPDDGLLNPLGRAPQPAVPGVPPLPNVPPDVPPVPPPVPDLPLLPFDPTNPGANPYCVGCTAFPAQWTTIPGDSSAYQLIGYGSVDPLGADLAKRILSGVTAGPDRAVEDAFFGLDQQLRGVVDQVP